MPLESTLASPRKGLCLLSLDAGGTRAISQLEILTELLHRLNFISGDDNILRPCDVFDVIGGIGSGGFIAILLVILKLGAEQALEEFLELSVKVLEKRGIDAQARTVVLKDYIERLLEKHKFDKERSLVDSSGHLNGCNLVVPISYKDQNDSTCTLRNFNVRNEQALNLTISEALYATLATPPLFTSTSFPKDALIFEGIAADSMPSNPTREIVAEADEIFGGEARVACLLNVGCGHPGIFQALGESDLASWGLLLERLAADSERQAQSIDAQLGRLGIYYRFCLTRGLVKPDMVTVSDAEVFLTLAALYLSEVVVSRKMNICVDILRRRDGVVSLDQLSHSGGQSTTLPILPPVTRTFVMRKKPWEFMEKAIFGADDSEDITGPRRLAVTGIGGCGKTQMVLKFLQVHREKFDLCLFVDGSSKPRIRADVVQHVRSLGTAHSRYSFEDCLHFLSRSSLAGQRVIVYDSVDDPDLDLAPLLPMGNSCVVIITSRNHSIGRLSTAHLKLDVMSIEEAIKLLLFSTDPSTTVTDQTKKEARAIAEALGCLPIALQQARSYMFQTQCSASSYLKRLVESRDKLLALPVKFALDMRFNSTYSAFEMSFITLAPHSAKFLRLLSNFHWSKFPLELVILAATLSFSEYRVMYVEYGDDFYEGKAVLEDIFLRDGEWNIVNLDEMMIDLQNHSLITLIPGVGTLLVEMQLLLHGWVKSCIPEQETGAYQSAAVLLLALGARSEHTSCAQYLASHVNHLSVLWGHLNVNNAEAFSSILDGGGSYEGAVQLRERVATELRNQVEPNSVNIANSISALSLSYCALGRFSEAEQLQREAQRLLADTLGKHHPDTIAACNNLAATYHDMGRLEEAELMQQEVLKLRKEILGERHPHTITASNNLAATYLDLGRLNEAEMLLLKVLRLRKEILGGRHPDTVMASDNLAATYRRLGRLEEAELLQEEVLKLRKEILGERHSHTITASHNLAATYYDMGRLEEAELMQQEVLKLWREILGERHPKTITALSALAATYFSLGSLSKARALQEEALKHAKEILGDRHPNTISAMATQAGIYAEQGQWSESEKLQLQSMANDRDGDGTHPSHTSTAGSVLAAIYSEQEKWNETELLQLDILEKRRKTLGEDHVDTIRAAANLACSYHMQGNWKDAGNLRLEVLEKRRKIFGDNHPLTILAAEGLDSTHRAPKEVEAAMHFEMSLSTPIWLMEETQKVIERVRMWYHPAGPLAKAMIKEPSISITGHSYRVQLIALNFELSETFMMIGRNATFGQIGFYLHASNTARLPVAMEQLSGPFPRWRIPNIDSRVPRGLQKIYVVDIKEPFTLALVRNMAEDFPLLLPLASFNAGTVTMGDLVGASLGGRAKPIASVRLLSISDDIQKQACQLVREGIKEACSTTLFVLLNDDPMAYRFRSQCDGGVTPALRLTLPPCRSLVESAPRLKAFDLQAIGLSRALLHLTICLAEAAAESKVEGGTEAYLIARLNKLIDKLNGIFLDIERSTESARPGIKHSMDQFFYELCEEQPGAVSVRQIFESFKPLTPFSYENSGPTSKPTSGVHEGKATDPAKTSAYEAENSSTGSSDSLTASDGESAEAPHQQGVNKNPKTNTTQEPRVQPAPGPSLYRPPPPTQSFSAASTVFSTATTSRLEAPAVGTAKAGSSRPQGGFSRVLDKVFRRRKRSPSAGASTTSNVSLQSPPEG